jgi:hypothetical protein
VKKKYTKHQRLRPLFLVFMGQEPQHQKINHITSKFSYPIKLGIQLKESKQSMNRNKANNRASKQNSVTTTAVIDLVVFTAFCYMLLHKRFGVDGRNRRGTWAPNVLYLPVLLLRWALVPHKDWTREHQQHTEELNANLFQHHHTPHHHHHHHHHHHIPKFVGDDL